MTQAETHLRKIFHVSVCVRGSTKLWTDDSPTSRGVTFKEAPIEADTLEKVESGGSLSHFAPVISKKQILHNKHHREESQITLAAGLDNNWSLENCRTGSFTRGKFLVCQI